MAERGSLHWITVETVMLCRSWSHVSMEFGGPGGWQPNTQFWTKVTRHYDSLSPPLPRYKSGVAGAPRQKSALFNKWGRMGPILSKFIKHMNFCSANHHSGENLEQETERALDLYEKECGHAFRYMLEYKVFAPYPKWMLDRVGDKEQVDGRAGVAHETPVSVRLGRVTEAAPTCANTDKPIGVKRARRILSQVAQVEKEIAVEEARLVAYVETFSHLAEIGFKTLELLAARNESLDCVNDDLIMMFDTSSLTPELKQAFLLRQKVAMLDVVDRCNAAVERRSVAAAAAAADAVSAAVAAATAAATAAADAAAAAEALLSVATAEAAALAAAAEAENEATQEGFDACAAGRAGGFLGEEVLV